MVNKQNFLYQSGMSQNPMFRFVELDQFRQTVAHFIFIRSGENRDEDSNQNLAVE